MSTHPLLRRWARFAAAGLGGFIVQLAILAALTAWTRLHYVVATVLAVELAILFNFTWHEQWTWRDRPSAGWRERWRRLTRFHVLTGLTSIVGTTVLTAALVETLGVSPLIGNAAAVITLGLLNFAGSEALVFRAAAVVAVLATASADGATLQPKTVKDFTRYAAAVEARTSRELTVDGPFLSIDRQPSPKIEEARAVLRRGSVLVMKGSASDESSHEIEIDGGNIHHWRGVVLVPNVKLDYVLRTLKEPGRDQHKQEDVLSTRVLSRNGDTLKLFLRLKRTKIVTVVYDTEHDVRYWMLAPGRAASSSVSTRIVEVENAGTRNERMLPEGDDHGYLWRLNSYWRYQQVDGGVIVELESLSLSRDIPFVFKPFVSPLIGRVARESVRRTLESLRARLTATATAL
ncbi:MAG: GtrA family protein [Vicinamibacterales bacterium]